MKAASDWFPRSSNIHFKLNETAKFLQGNYSDSDITGRADRYPLLLKAFIAHPILGHFIAGRNYDISPGVHLHWMNKLAVYGLLVQYPFFILYIHYIKESMKYFDKEFKFYFLLSTFSIIALGFMKTLMGSETWYVFFIIVPGFYYLPLLKKKNRIYAKVHYQ